MDDLELFEEFVILAKRGQIRLLDGSYTEREMEAGHKVYAVIMDPLNAPPIPVDDSVFRWNRKIHFLFNEDTICGTESYNRIKDTKRITCKKCIKQIDKLENAGLLP